MSYTKSLNYAICPDGLMVKVSESQVVLNCLHVFESRLGQFFFSPNFFFYCKFILANDFNTFLTFMELMKGLEEADKVHVLDK